MLKGVAFGTLFHGPGWSEVSGGEYATDPMLKDDYSTLIMEKNEEKSERFQKCFKFLCRFRVKNSALRRALI